MSGSPDGGAPADGDAFPLRVRYGETDAMGVVYHPNFLVYFEQGRTEFLRRRGFAYRELERAGALLVVVECGCRYRASARYDDVLRVKTWLEQVTRVRVGFRYEVVRESDGLLLAEGFTKLACVDRNGRPRALPAEVTAALGRPRGVAP
ncbi:MAG: acyl-CoA thioesterase [Planctomycetes bacterium]|nr:acyl-CoA thioesterase [Planctomycetota bacterium]